MRVFFFTEGTQASPASRLRAYEYFAYLRKMGFSPRAASFTSQPYCRRLVEGKTIGEAHRLLEKTWQARAVLRLLAGALTCRVVVIQRVLLPVWLQRLVSRLNPRVIFDYDDAVHLGREREFASQVRLAARVIAVSETAREAALTAGAPAERVMVLPTPVDCASYRTRDQRLASREEADRQFNDGPGRFLVGWIGSPATTPFLQQVWPRLAELAAREPRVAFLFIGARPFDTGLLAGRATFLSWSREYETKLLSSLDAGIMPLPDDQWCRGKGGYKLIQYMAAGVPGLASPVGANNEIVAEGATGSFVGEDRGWGPALERLLRDPELAARLGREGRRRAERLYDYSVAAPRLAELIRAAAGVEPRAGTVPGEPPFAPAGTR